MIPPGTMPEIMSQRFLKHVVSVWPAYMADESRPAHLGHSSQRLGLSWWQLSQISWGVIQLGHACRVR